MNIDTSGFSFGDLGGSKYNFGSFGGAFDSVTEGLGGQTFVGDAWDSTLGFLSSGLNVYKDYLTVTGKGPNQMPANGSPDQWAEGAIPQDTQAQYGGSRPSGQLVPGVGNGVLLLAGAALAVVFLTK